MAVVFLCTARTVRRFTQKQTIEMPPMGGAREQCPKADNSPTAYLYRSLYP